MVEEAGLIEGFDHLSQYWTSPAPYLVSFSDVLVLKSNSREKQDLHIFHCNLEYAILFSCLKSNAKSWSTIKMYNTLKLSIHRPLNECSVWMETENCVEFWINFLSFDLTFILLKTSRVLWSYFFWVGKGEDYKWMWLRLTKWEGVIKTI